MTTIDLDRLEQIAQAATRGAWGVDGPANPAPDDNLAVGPDTGEGFNPDTGEGVIAYVQPSWDDATHIAAFDPPTVLALIARIRDLEAERTRWKERWKATVEDASEQHATIQLVRDLHMSEDGYCVKCSEEYGLTTGTYPCPPIQALEECQQ